MGDQRLETPFIYIYIYIEEKEVGQEMSPEGHQKKQAGLEEDVTILRSTLGAVKKIRIKPVNKNGQLQKA